MTWLDVIAVALFVIVGVVEAKRGFFPALVDLCLVLVSVNLAKMLAPSAASAVGSNAAGFGVVVFGLIAITAVASTLVDVYAKWDIGPYDSLAGGVLGAVTGLAVAHAVYHLAQLKGAEGHALVARSLLAPEIYDLRSLHALGDMLRGLGGGPRITDQVRKSQD
jgi:uncharacterized membrane protein required for colicin V production